MSPTRLSTGRAIVFGLLVSFLSTVALAADDAPAPMPKDGQAVDWWFVFKFNAKSYPKCGKVYRVCTYGGNVQPYKLFSHQRLLSWGDGRHHERDGVYFGRLEESRVGVLMTILSIK